MARTRKDLTGQRFGMLVVREPAEDYITPQGVHIPSWICDCDCGTSGIVIVGGSLTRKHRPTRSCGCQSIMAAKNNGLKNKKYNKYNLTGEYGIGFAHNTNNEFYFDLEDYDKIKDYCWIEVEDCKSGYRSIEARNLEDGKRIKMTNVIGCKNFDHKNRNPLDNRKANLRKTTHTQNMQNCSLRSNNTSGITGVDWHKKTLKWRARIVVNGVELLLGSYINFEDAVRARLQGEKKYFGEFAPQQHLYDEYGILNTTE